VEAERILLRSALDEAALLSRTSAWPSTADAEVRDVSRNRDRRGGPPAVKAAVEALATAPRIRIAPHGPQRAPLAGKALGRSFKARRHARRKASRGLARI
jgi:hypothetical protein